jgi:hypothetical protein
MFLDHLIVIAVKMRQSTRKIIKPFNLIVIASVLKLGDNKYS